MRSTADVNDCPSPLPVFPLPLFVLPGGVQRLRVFEPKYLSMVASAVNGDGFVIASSHSTQRSGLPDWGTRVQIIDFNQGVDNILTVDVIGEHLVSLSIRDTPLAKSSASTNTLLLADTHPIAHWSMIEGTSESIENKFAPLLRKIFKQHSALRALYKQTHFGEAAWVGARLLEIVPLSFEEKENFIHLLGLPELNRLLDTLFLKLK